MKRPKKERLDVLLTEKGFFPTRQKAQSAIMAGLIYIDQKRIDKAGTKVYKDANIIVKGDPIPYVSRGGLKLEKGLEEFDIPVKDRVFLDVGASTGGFTDCLLQNGARRVYAIDVGYGQLDWGLRNDERVIVLERTNIRHLEPKGLPELAHGAVIDVSFISLRLAIPKVAALIAESGDIVALIKPQFEAGINRIGKKGVVSKPKVHQDILMEILEFIESNDKLSIKGLTYSPVKGPEGNIEFLIHIMKTPFEIKTSMNYIKQIPNVVGAAHKHLDK
ncbi:MAG: TlyA family RNA methyltransferase [Clostridiales bacterium]|nr:TlyA family RNA methyltransferase [Clostridiales bacterium]